ncbi:MAG: hypothetical protein IPK87_00510 [Planctomycetes bacterium]|nr:hypothetical protein [Planctomycetota bacterium]
MGQLRQTWFLARCLLNSHDFSWVQHTNNGRNGHIPERPAGWQAIVERRRRGNAGSHAAENAKGNETTGLRAEGRYCPQAGEHKCTRLGQVMTPVFTRIHS